MSSLGLLYSTRERIVVSREDFALTTQFSVCNREGERQICPNKSREGVACTYSGGENVTVWLVDTVLMSKVTEESSG